MKNHSSYLTRLASRLLIKHGLDASTLQAEIATAIKTAISNAASQTASGIMPFLKMLSQDQATLSLSIQRAGENVSVSPPMVNPGSAAPRYAALSGQIEAYLSKNLTLFPSVRNGESVSYSNFSMTLEFAPAEGQAQPIASR